MITQTSFRLLSITALALIGASNAFAQYINQGFETGTIDAWESSSNARVSVHTNVSDYPVDPFSLELNLSASPYTVIPGEGVYFARLEAGGSALADTERFLGHKAGMLSTPANDPFQIADATAIAQNSFLRAGSNYTFLWNFYAVDLAGMEDFAFFSAVGTGHSELRMLASVSDFGTGYGSGWKTINFTPTSSGIYRIGFGVANAADNTVNSLLYVDRAPVTPVPEPSTYGLLGAVACSGLILWRRRRR